MNYTETETHVIDSNQNIWHKDSLTSYQWWQLEKYGNILVDRFTMPCGHTEASQEAMEKEAEWVNQQHEREMWEHEGMGLSDY